MVLPMLETMAMMTMMTMAMMTGLFEVLLMMVQVLMQLSFG
jgi:hypothetical protein